MKKWGFTLAEVLITLAITGIVAALTIPVVVRNYQKTQTVTQLKKIYSALANTTNLAIADHGPIESWEIGSGDHAVNAANFANKYMIPYLKVSRNCENKTGGVCDLKYATLKNPENKQNFPSNYARFYLNDGSSVVLWLTDPSSENKVAGVIVDINGQKKPNVYGKDIFVFRYYINYPGRKGFVPFGYNYSRNDIISDVEQRCNKNQSGELCSALIMKDGWQIKDDYAW